MIVTHGIVYAEEGVYAGWPANHGAWQWGDEFLVGFLRGKYSTNGDMHSIIEPYEKMLARSLDGGKNWRLVKPQASDFAPIDFECKVPRYTPVILGLGGDVIIRVCGVYDHGGEYCAGGGGFYLSRNRGMTWSGPHIFFGLEFIFKGDGICTARTCVLPGRDLVFLSKGNTLVWGTDSVICVRYHGYHFEYLSTVCADDARAVMPSAIRFRNDSLDVDERIVVALRRRKSGRRACWVDVVHSDDGGLSWSPPRFVGSTGGHNGNPPALKALPDGRLLCAYGNRDEGSIVLAVSEDLGMTWNSVLLRKNDIDNVDLGYPQLFLRTDGTPVCVYYWISSQLPCQHIAYTEIEL
jgi:hypothetical protein